MLVADALDVVLAEAVHEQRRAFDRFDHGDLGAVLGLQIVAGGERAGRAAGGDESRRAAGSTTSSLKASKIARAPGRCIASAPGSCRTR